MMLFLRLQFTIALRNETIQWGIALVVGHNIEEATNDLAQGVSSKYFCDLVPAGPVEDVENEG